MYSLHIRQARTALNLTIKDLSRLTGIPEASLSRIERGLQDPTVKTLTKIGKALPSEAPKLIRWET